MKTALARRNNGMIPIIKTNVNGWTWQNMPMVTSFAVQTIKVGPTYPFKKQTIGGSWHYSLGIPSFYIIFLCLSILILTWVMWACLKLTGFTSLSLQLFHGRCTNRMRSRSLGNELFEGWGNAAVKICPVITVLGKTYVYIDIHIWYSNYHCFLLPNKCTVES